MIVTPEELKDIRQQAEDEYPDECCGVVMTRADERRLLRFRNAQDEMHRIDPQRYPRTARMAYYVGFDDHMRMDALAAQGFALAVIYHSHPDAAAYFSPTDRDQAAPKPTSQPEDPGPGAPPKKREPLWPGVTYVVVSVAHREAKEVAAFRWDTTAEDFEEIHRETLVPLEDVTR
jgi:adenylyltransferase/sulfurtransferase